MHTTHRHRHHRAELTIDSTSSIPVPSPAVSPLPIITADDQNHNQDTGPDARPVSRNNGHRRSTHQYLGQFAERPHSRDSASSDSRRTSALSLAAPNPGNFDGGVPVPPPKSKARQRLSAIGAAGTNTTSTTITTAAPTSLATLVAANARSFGSNISTATRSTSTSTSTSTGTGTGTGTNAGAAVAQIVIQPEFSDASTCTTTTTTTSTTSTTTAPSSFFTTVSPTLSSLSSSSLLLHTTASSATTATTIHQSQQSTTSNSNTSTSTSTSSSNSTIRPPPLSLLLDVDTANRIVASKSAPNSALHSSPGVQLDWHLSLSPLVASFAQSSSTEPAAAVAAAATPESQSQSQQHQHQHQHQRQRQYQQATLSARESVIDPRKLSVGPRSKGTINSRLSIGAFSTASSSSSSSSSSASGLLVGAAPAPAPIKRPVSALVPASASSLSIFAGPGTLATAPSPSASHFAADSDSDSDSDSDCGALGKAPTPQQGFSSKPQQQYQYQHHNQHHNQHQQFPATSNIAIAASPPRAKSIEPSSTAASLLQVQYSYGHNPSTATATATATSSAAHSLTSKASLSALSSSALAAAAPIVPGPQALSRPFSPLFLQTELQNQQQNQQQNQHQHQQQPSLQSSPALSSPCSFLTASPHFAADSAPDVAADTDTDINPGMSTTSSNHDHDYRDFSSRQRDRDSHDLSLPIRNGARDSLMTSMLMSLDQFSSLNSSSSLSSAFHPAASASATASATAAAAAAAAASSPPTLFDDFQPLSFDDRAWTTTSASAAAAAAAAALAHARSRSRTHSITHGVNSYSSDFDVPDDASRISSRAGRRSNSSSNFHYPPASAGLARISSLHSQSTTPRLPLHSRSRQGSKSSSTNSIDASHPPQTSLTQRWAQSTSNITTTTHSDFAASLFSATPASPQTAAAQFVQQQITQREREREAHLILLQQAQQAQQAQLRGLQSLTNRKPSWQIDLETSFLADEYDAAPPPAIPGGPRRTASSALPAPPPSLGPANGPGGDSPHTQRPVSPRPPPPPPPEPKTPVLDRKRSIRSTKSSGNGRRRNSSKGHQSQYDTSPLPAMDCDSAPAPNVSYEKAKDSQASAGPNGQGIPNGQQHNQREKQGFFRRVFGSRNASAAGLTEAPPIETPDRSKSQSTPPSREAIQPHPLQKKTSAFFRRRKKSFTDNDAPPLPMPPPIPAASASASQSPSQSPGGGGGSGSPLPSGNRLPGGAGGSSLGTLQPGKLLGANASADLGYSTSSLRQATSPYVKGGSGAASGGINLGMDLSVSLEEYTTPSTPERPGIRHRHSINPSDPGYKRSFSPEYDPSPTAVIRKVDRDAESVYSTASERGERAENHRRQTQQQQQQQQQKTQHTPGSNRGTPSRTKITSTSGDRANSFLNLDHPSDGEVEGWTRRAYKSADKKAGQRRRSSRSRSRSSSRNRSRSPRHVLNAATTTKNSAYSRAKAQHNHAADGNYSDSDLDDDRRNSVMLPIEGIRQESVSASIGAAASSSTINMTQNMNIPKIVGGDEKGSSPGDPKNIDEPDLFIIGDPTDDDRNKAQRIFDGDESFIQREKAAAWMGEEGPVRQRALRAYMELYDFKNTSIVESLRQVCNRLIFRAETQQVDRILVCFSNRWEVCNPRHGFKTIDVIHTICYSIFLLNTDLHIADIEQKMTRPQFIRNTMETIRQALQESDPEFFEQPEGLTAKHDRSGNGPSKRSSFLPLRPAETPYAADLADCDECGPLVKAPFDGNFKAWEGIVEIVLKEVYGSIRDERLPLMGAEPERMLNAAPTQSGLSVMSMLKRSPSVLSKTPSEGQGSLRGRIPDSSSRNSSSRWTSKSRSRPRFGAPGFSSSRTSFDDQNSVWSPSASSTTWSKQSLGRTQTSLSMDSFGSGFGRGDFQQSIGFANALSQAIIRDDLPGNASIVSDDMKTSAPLLDDESLELAGPPWVKEGLVSHKHHLDGVDKKAKDRNWSEVFAVIQKGNLSIFSFQPSKSMRNRRAAAARHGKGGPITVGGGNWQDNATNLGTFDLRQTLASALPPPGYSRTRPHVWALSLPTGAVHLFQAGTPELVKEFVTSVNYWSARLSTHPLVGGISNIEYGWSNNIVNHTLITAIADSSAGVPPPAPPTKATGVSSRPGSAAAHNRQPSMTGSVRSARSASFDHGSGGARGGGGKLPGDRVHITDWMPPTQSMRASTLGEAEQLAMLQAYVRGIEADLQIHNQLRSPMMLAYTPRGSNAGKAMANWERKSAYLLREIVKFRTYVDCLTQAETRRREIYAEREHARRAARGDLDLSGDEESDVEEGVRLGL